MESLVKKLEQIKIADDCYFGENLEHKHNFLNDLEEKNQEKFEDSECSNFFCKRTMSLCVEMNQEIAETKAKKLLEIVDWLTDEHFAKKLILREVGWCAQQMLQKRILNYKKGEELIKRVHLIEFYWFNSSPVCFGEKETESSLTCNCNYCEFFLSCF